MRVRSFTLSAIAIGFALTLPARAAPPPGWAIAGISPADYEFAVDATTAASGSKSASITAKPSAKKDGFATLMQSIAADEYRGSRLRLSGYLRTDSATRALMWMRVDGPTGKVVSFDNMDSRPLTGTTAWSRYSIVLDVPSDSADIAFGFLLYGNGKMWGDGFRLDKVDAAVAVTSAGPPLSRAPVNLDFEDSETGQSVVWAPRTLRNFGVPVASDTGGVGHDAQLSCDELAEELRLLLLQLGARAGDLHIDQRDCPRDERQLRLIDATFSVLVPAVATGTKAAGTLAGHWQPVELKTGTAHKEFRSSRVPSWTFTRDCSYLQYVAQMVLPLFSRRNVDESSQAVCDKTDVGFRAEVLMPAQQSESAR